MQAWTNEAAKLQSLDPDLMGSSAAPGICHEIVKVCSRNPLQIRLEADEMVELVSRMETALSYQTYLLEA